MCIRKVNFVWPYGGTFTRRRTNSFSAKHSGSVFLELQALLEGRRPRGLSCDACTPRLRICTYTYVSRVLLHVRVRTPPEGASLSLRVLTRGFQCAEVHVGGSDPESVGLPRGSPARHRGSRGSDVLQSPLPVNIPRLTTDLPLPNEVMLPTRG